MTDHAIETPARDFSKTAKKTLDNSVKFCFSVMALGQWVFVFYVLVNYGGAALSGDLKAWNEASSNAFIEGDTVGNVAFLFHIALAIVIIGGGPLQLIPAIRNRVPVFHRWLGRTYMVTAVVSSLAGLYLITTREIPGGLILQLGISGDALLILAFAFLAWKCALARDFTAHRRWALRLFLAASAVWFFRIGFMGWLMIVGPVGVDFNTFSGPFLSFLTFGQYLVPLAVLELYFWAQTRAQHVGRFATSGVLVLSGLVMIVGTVGAAMGMWFPS